MSGKDDELVVANAVVDGDANDESKKEYDGESVADGDGGFTCPSPSYVSAPSDDVESKVDVGDGSNDGGDAGVSGSDRVDVPPAVVSSFVFLR